MPCINCISRLSTFVLIAICLLVSSRLTTSAQEPTSPLVVWDEPMLVPSPPETSSWFPDMAVDSMGRVHLVWCETDHFGAYDRETVSGARLIEQVFYTFKDETGWRGYNDIAPPQVDINRNTVAIDGYDNLHLLSGWFRMDYQQVDGGGALSIRNWSDSRLLNGKTLTYLKDVAIYRDTIHAVYDDAGASGKDLVCSECADTYYIRSLDLGATWSKPMNLYPTDDAGSSRAQIKIDKHGGLYVVWDEGWDRIREVYSSQRYGVYRYSSDLGESWSSPVLVSYPNFQNSHLTVGSNGDGGVMLVWRTVNRGDGYFYMWSLDYGKSWTPPQRIPNFLPRDIASAKFDLYDMAADSLGNIHLAVVGSLTGNNDRTPHLYHFAWDGKTWSSPTIIYDGDQYPEYPKIVAENGNRLHVAWFNRIDPFEFIEPYQVMYTQALLSSVPAETPIPLPTHTPSPLVKLPTSTPTATPRATVTSTPTIAAEILNQPASPSVVNIYTDSDEIFTIFLSLLPSLSIVATVILAVRAWRRRSD